MSTTALQRSAFYDVQDQLGAEWTDWEGWAWADHFGDAEAEHRATRDASNIWDESPLRKWDMKGPDALALADVLFTNDMSALEVGQVRYGAICDEDGQMIMDGTIFKYADDHCFSITSYDSDLDWFRKVASDRGLDVQVEDMTAEMPHLQVQGPQVAGDPRPPHRRREPRRAALLPLRAGGGHGRRGAVHGVPHRLLRRARLRAVLQARARRGPLERRTGGRPPQGMLPIGLRRSRRSGSSRACSSPTSTTSSTRPTRSRSGSTSWSSSTSPVTSSARRPSGESRGGHASPAHHAAAGGRRDARVRGRRSRRTATRSGSCGAPVRARPSASSCAMAAIDRELAKEGTTVDVALGDGTVSATVAPFPIYDPQKSRPRS